MQQKALIDFLQWAVTLVGPNENLDWLEVRSQEPCGRKKQTRSSKLKI
jgi:hypothetical protein